MRYFDLRYCALAAAVVTAGCAGGSARVPSALLPQSRAVESASSRMTSTVLPTSVSTLFVADAPTNTIVEYPAGAENPTPIERITDGISNPIDITTDARGTLYVANAGAPESTPPTITEYPAGATAPSRTIVFDGLKHTPDHIAVGPDETLYVVLKQGDIFEYYRGAHEPSLVVPEPRIHGSPLGIITSPVAVDPQNDLFISYYGGACCGNGVLKFPPKSKTFSYVAGSVNIAGPLAFDEHEDLLIGNDYQPPRIVVLKDGKHTKFSAPLTSYLSFDAPDDLLYTAYGTVTIIDYTTQQVVGHISGIYDATGIAVSPNTY
jgi:hypothetical protein